MIPALWLTPCESQMLGIHIFNKLWRKNLMAVANKKSFYFKKYNLLLSQNCGPSLKLTLALNLLRDVDRSFEYFDNELQPEVEQVVSTVRKIVKANKQLAKDATLQRQQAEEAKTDERQGPSSEATMS